ncbi:MAG TPA: hypothetical protein VEY09_16680 [Pyrinomonadaceae bacterium]|nr:hypothetical protein [Pyrinomonadaceae bacterium]
MSEREAEAGAGTGDAARDDEENELRAEEDSAQAMDAEVSHGDEDSETTEGQPS